MSDDRSQSDPDLLRAGQRLATAGSLDEVVATLRETTRRIAGSDGIAVVLRENGFCHYVAEDAIQPLWRGRRFPLEACISGWAMLHDETVVIPFLELDPRVPVEAYRNTAMRSLVMVPIGSPKPIAALGAYWCACVLPGEAIVKRLETLARAAADALARLRAGAEIADCAADALADALADAGV